jgi:hypothetical protein
MVPETTRTAIEKVSARRFDTIGFNIQVSWIGRTTWHRNKSLRKIHDLLKTVTGSRFSAFQKPPFW